MYVIRNFERLREVDTVGFPTPYFSVHYDAPNAKVYSDQTAKKVLVTPIESGILIATITQPGNLVPYASIFSELVNLLKVRFTDTPADVKTLSTHIDRLRQKLINGVLSSEREYDPRYRLLYNRRGFRGYVFLELP